jgi:hypothetical protein
MQLSWMTPAITIGGAMEQNSISASLRYGLRFGAATAVLGVVLALSDEYVLTQHPAHLGIFRLEYDIIALVSLVLAVGAGVFTTQRTEEVRSGAIAGGIAFACGAVGFSLVFAIVFALGHGGIFAGSSTRHLDSLSPHS